MSEPDFIPIPPKETLLQNLRKGLELAKLTQRDVAKLVKDNQGNISKQLRGKKRISIDRITYISSLILERISSIPKKSLEEVYTKSEDVETVNNDDPVSLAVLKMNKGDFTQLPVIDAETKKCMGIVTDFAIMKRACSPLEFKKKIENARVNTVSQFNWISEFKSMAIKDAKVIDEAPTYLLNTPIAEIAQALLFHYAVLILEKQRKTGIVTRADFLKKIL